jgi:hypothetical protein
MTHDIKIDVGEGWSDVVLDLLRIGSLYPERWGFRFHRAWRASGRMRIHVTTSSDDIECVKMTADLSKIAWDRSGVTCEVCGRIGCLSLGTRYALTLCRDHEYLVGERHPDDGKIADLWKAHRDGFIKLPIDYDDPDVVTDTLLRMLSRREAASADVRQILRMARSPGLLAAIDGMDGATRH